MARWLWKLICNILITIVPILGLWGLNEMIPVGGLELVSLSLLLPSFSPFLCMPTHLTSYLTSLSSPTSESAQDLQRGEEGTMMKINLNCSCAKSPRLTRSWVTCNQPNFQENRSHCPIFFIPETLSNQIRADDFEKSRWAPPPTGAFRVPSALCFFWH